MQTLSAALLCDFYKISHRNMYPLNTEVVYSTWTPRGSRIPGADHVVVFGFQAFIKKYLIEFFSTHFFNRPKQEVVAEYRRVLKHTLNQQNVDASHIEALHDLGYLPLSIKALPEGSVVPLRVPTLTLQNTDPRFFWLTNYIETLASCELWQSATSATIARQYRKILDSAAMRTVGNTESVMFQGHDFSMRGMSSLDSAVSSGMGHLTAFVGTDTLPAIQGAEMYYHANVEKELVGTSIPATEHSVQCAYGDDLAYFRNIIERVHPQGFVSIVSDGYDFWDVLEHVLPTLKSTIMNRDGRVVIRPDSGDPVKIVCGDPEAPKGSAAYKGAVEVLWETFGGTYSTVACTHNGGKGYNILDPHIGLIYGDAITLSRCNQICDRLAAKGFASTNCIFGIGSYTYQYNTRDTFGFALKSTACVVDGQEKQIFKDPKADDGLKKSQKGRVVVLRDDHGFTFRDGLSLQDVVPEDKLREIYRDGKLLVEDTFAEVRARLAAEK